jgi:ABC-type ATPase with predicted acetyltransferase domain
MALCAGLTVACVNPCEKLAKAVCERTRDERVCAGERERARVADKAIKEKCADWLASVDRFVAGLERVAEMKALFRKLARERNATPAASTPSLTPDAGARAPPEAKK